MDIVYCDHAVSCLTKRVLSLGFGFATSNLTTRSWSCFALYCNMAVDQSKHEDIHQYQRETG